MYRVLVTWIGHAIFAAPKDLNRRYAVILSTPLFAGQVPAESVRQDLPSKSKKKLLSEVKQ